jgi:hypothetical protein
MLWNLQQIIMYSLIIQLADLIPSPRILGGMENEKMCLGILPSHILSPHTIQ